MCSHLRDELWVDVDHGFAQKQRDAALLHSRELQQRRFDGRGAGGAVHPQHLDLHRLHVQEHVSPTAVMHGCKQIGHLMRGFVCRHAVVPFRQQKLMAYITEIRNPFPVGQRHRCVCAPLPALGLKRPWLCSFAAAQCYSSLRLEDRLRLWRRPHNPHRQSLS